MSEAKGNPNASEEGAPPPIKSGNLLPPWKPGQSGNPAGRPRVEPRVRKFARRYDRRMCRVLASIAEDPKVPPSERRRAASDLIAIGSGRPALIQEIAGRPDAPLVAVNFGMHHGSPLSPEDAYRLMVQGVIEPDGGHPAFARPALEQPSVTAEKTEDAP